MFGRLLDFLLVIVMVAQIGVDIVGGVTPFTALDPDTKRNIIIAMATLTFLGDIVALVIIVARNLTVVWTGPAHRRSVMGQAAGLATSLLLTLGLFFLLSTPVLGYQLTVIAVVVYFLIQLGKDGSTLGNVFR